MKKLLRHPLLYLILIQALLILVGLNPVFSRGEDCMLVDVYDGLKNYYTYWAYLMQPAADGMSLFTQMQYPYGDYVFYTDNTPLLAVPMRWISLNIVDLRPHAFLIHNLFVAVGILITSLLCYGILKQLIKSGMLIFVASICLPWIHPQNLRIFTAGHFNLSFAWLLLLVVYLLLRYYHRYREEPRILYIICLELILVMVFSSFIHIYYVMLEAVMVASFAFFWGLIEYRYKVREFIQVNASLILSCIVALGIAMLVIKSVDGYYELRKVRPEGYDYSLWKLNFSALFTHYNFNFFKFPLASIKNPPYESYAYLGNFALYIGLFMTGRWILKSKSQTRFKQVVWKGEKGKLMLILLLAASLSLLISMGDVYKLPDSGLKVYNYLNPFFYIGKFYERITQFRCISRFSWVFFWVFNFLVLWLLDTYVRRIKPYSLLVLLIGCVLLISDTRDFVKTMNGNRRNNRLHNTELIGEMKALSAKINPAEYQAILPLPYYHTGSEDYDHTIGVETWWYTQTLQLNQLTQLPLMSTTLSRTPVSHTHDLFSLFLSPKPSPDLRARLNKKPILVAYNTLAFAPGSKYPRPKRERARKALDACKDFPERKGLELVAEHNHVKLYRYYPLEE